MRIYVGNLSYDVTEEELQQEFMAYGEVTSVSILTDKFSGRPKGFGFVEMTSKSELPSTCTAQKFRGGGIVILPFIQHGRPCRIKGRTKTFSKSFVFV